VGKDYFYPVPYTTSFQYNAKAEWQSVEVVTETNTMNTFIYSAGISYCHSVVSQLFIDLITHIPLPLIKREEGLLAAKTIYCHLI
jgi:hypothetical protein